MPIHCAAQHLSLVGCPAVGLICSGCADGSALCEVEMSEARSAGLPRMLSCVGKVVRMPKPCIACLVRTETAQTQRAQWCNVSHLHILGGLRRQRGHASLLQGTTELGVLLLQLRRLLAQPLQLCSSAL